MSLGGVNQSNLITRDFTLENFSKSINKEENINQIGKRKFNEINKESEGNEHVKNKKTKKIVVIINNRKESEVIEKEIIEIEDDVKKSTTFKPLLISPSSTPEYIYIGSKLDNRACVFGKLIKYIPEYKLYNCLQGFFKNGNDPLTATITVGDKYFFYGEIKNRRPNGIGLFRCQERMGIGFFKDAFLNGYGVVFENNAPIESGIFTNNKLTLEENRLYTPITLEDGSIYCGRLIDGQLTEGLLTTPKGTRYQGQFKNNKAHGLGLNILKNGDVYVGSFADGQRTGIGITYLAKNGYESYYYGEFKNNKYDGTGTLVLNRSSKYMGSFKNGRKDGPGLIEIELYLGNIKHISQNWSDGKLIESIEPRF
jgi:hypothetical protein